MSAIGMSMLKKFGFKPEFGPKVLEMLDSMSVGVPFLVGLLPVKGAAVRTC